MLEIKDRVLLKDGRSILSTIGAKRFRVLSGSERDGYDTAQVEFLRDTPVETDQLLNIAKLHNKVIKKKKNSSSPSRNKKLLFIYLITFF